jgi:hypothetical protein
MYGIGLQVDAMRTVVTVTEQQRWLEEQTVKEWRVGIMFPEGLRLRIMVKREQEKIGPKQLLRPYFLTTTNTIPRQVMILTHIHLRRVEIWVQRAQHMYMNRPPSFRVDSAKQGGLVANNLLVSFLHHSHNEVWKTSCIVEEI